MKCPRMESALDENNGQIKQYLQKNYTENTQHDFNDINITEERRKRQGLMESNYWNTMFYRQPKGLIMLMNYDQQATTIGRIYNVV